MLCALENASDQLRRRDSGRGNNFALTRQWTMASECAGESLLRQQLTTNGGLGHNRQPTARTSHFERVPRAHRPVVSVGLLTSLGRS
jgi:hypothetical protein